MLSIVLNYHNATLLLIIRHNVPTSNQQGTAGMANNTKKHNRPSAVAKAVRTPTFRMRVVESKVKYKRKDKHAERHA